MEQDQKIKSDPNFIFPFIKSKGHYSFIYLFIYNFDLFVDFQDYKHVYNAKIVFINTLLLQYYQSAPCLHLLTYF